MKLLFVVPYVPNAVRVRPWQLLRTLAARGHQLVLGTIYTSPTEAQELEALQALGVRVLAAPMSSRASALAALRALPQRRPLQSSWSWSPVLWAQLEALVQNEPIDAIHVEHLRGSRYAAGLQQLVCAGRAHAAARPPVVWDSVDSISHLFAQAAQRSSSAKSRAMSRLELGPTRREERRLAGLFPALTVTSPLDRDAFLALCPPAEAAALAPRIHVIPNGVDQVEFSFAGLEGRAPATVLFSGKLSYHANSTAALHLANEIMPHVWRARPDVELRLVGKEPPAALLHLAEGQGGAAPHRGGRVVVTGAVPSMGAELRAATVAAAPLLYGAGIQNKVLEAMACGTPVVASAAATAALEAVPGRELLVEESPEGFAAHLLRLLGAPEERQALGLAGRAFVQAHHSWEAAAARFEALYAVQQPG